MTNQLISKNDQISNPERRSFFGNLGKLTLSGTAVAMLAGVNIGTSGRVAHAAAPEDDVRILNTALGAEQEAVAAYQLGAESGLLQKPILDVAVKFQTHHKEHAAVLAKTIKSMGGTPVEPLKAYDFPVEKLISQDDVLKFAASLEKGAVSAYLGAVPLFEDRQLAKAAASILGDEAMHWAILRNVLGLDPVPTAFVS